MHGGKGGVLLLYALWFKKHVQNTGLLPRGAGVWLALKGHANQDIGVAALYAPNSPALRTRTWTELADFLDQSMKWVLLGDFNMTLNHEDHIGGTGTPIGGEERTAWNLLQGNLTLRDTFVPKNGQISFSWDNKRKVFLRDDHSPVQSINPLDPTLTKGRILKRLDRVYAHEDLLTRKFTSSILPGFMLSDHLPVLASLHLSNTAPEGTSKYRVNIDLLKDNQLQEKISTEWRQIELWHRTNSSSAERTFKACVKRAVSLCRHWGKLKAEKQRERTTQIRLEIMSLSCNLQIYPNCMQTETELHHQQLQLQAMEIQKANWAETLIQRKWEKDGDRCSKTFFTALRARKEKISVQELKTDEGITLTEEEDKAAWAQQFFAKLLQRATSDEGEQEATQSILDFCKTKVSEEQRSQLEEDYSLEELHKAALDLGKNKALGPDSLPVEFFLIFWQTAGPTLLSLAKDGLDVSHLPGYFTAGDIILLPKEGDQTLLQNKRPITLLNAGYKIVAKMLQNRMAPILQTIITWDENAFVQGRNLHATVFLCNQAVWEAKSNGKDCALLKVDFRKAFDSLSWDFLFKLLDMMCFGQKFIKIIKALTSTASSAVIVNKTRSSSIQIGRSVRQGCPISPLLFTVAMQAWTDYVNELQERQFLAGIFLPQAEIQYIQRHFADDTHLMLTADPQNLLNAKQAISVFGKASELTVQWNKSLATWISPTARPNWTNDLEWKWTQDQQEHRMLGFIFTDAINQDAVFSKCEQKIDMVLQEKRLTSQSLQGRITIANHIIYGYMWFILPLWAGKNKQLEEIDKRIVKFVWGGANTTPRQRIANRVLRLPRSQGGLVLLAAEQQASAFAAATVTRALTPGKPHPLKLLIRAAFAYQAETKWSSSIEAAILHTKKCNLDIGSPTMGFLLAAWAKTATLLKSPGITSRKALENTPIWVPQLKEVRDTTLKGKTQGHLALKRAGVTNIKHIADHTGRLRDLRDINLRLDSPPPVICNIDSNSIQKIFKEQEGGILTRSTDARFSQTGEWIRVTAIPIARGKKFNSRLILAQHNSLEEVLAQLQWQNGRVFFYFSNSHIRQALAPDKNAAISRMSRWKRITPYKEKDARRWDLIWNSKRPARQASFLWLILYSAIAVNRWRFPAASRSDPSTWCSRCSGNKAEDVLHLLWTCPTSKAIWDWAFTILHRAFPQLQGWKPRLAHALLAEPLPAKYKIASKWWEIWRGLVIWTIWKHRNELALRQQSFATAVIILIL
ncbi:hypothetical protein R1sor_019871 [Riccia sorocarpa]|uniref:Reverse transcriptase domain-containing protein n=1 Tax=Riccia sorocarpa TaxID=122646 RepID=A0ABD3IH17_9MARC